ncbi:cyclin-T1-4-like isoform X2 [Nymphaea colorata]|uniref:cyclin-T1-4-like isoform X2 n=1 Tax=Nymphaea colorata TaxID=210225 RepID=UPI00129E6A8A|nr:cyclin-T1-4-like isoform X2 [Nymphaea colorata]
MFEEIVLQLSSGIGRQAESTVTTACMFLAGKVEETTVLLRDVIVVAHSIIHKRDPVSAERIKQWKTYREKEGLILLAERLLLSTIGFDFNIIHPYKPLVTAIKSLKLGQSELSKVAWNTLNDCLQTTLCLQFKPAYIAAGAMYLAAKVSNVKLPCHGGKVWWQEFDVSPFQLEEVIKQMVELFIPNGRSVSCHHPQSSSKPLSKFNTTARDGLDNSSEISSHQWQNPVCVEVHVESGGSEVHSEVRHCENVPMDTSSSSMVLPEDGPQQKQGSHQCNVNGSSEMWIGVEISGVKNGSQKLSVNVISDVDRERIRAALKRRREGRTVKRAAVITNEEDEYDAWIEKELEDGIELAKPAECKLRYEEDAFDAWVEKELEDGIELMVKPAKKKLRHQEPIFSVQAV